MRFEIVDIEELSGSKAKIYSIMFDGEDSTLLDRFFEDNWEFEEELKDIAAVINSAIIDKDLIIKDDGSIEQSEFINLEI